MNKNNAKDFASQFINPLTLEDFKEAYGNGASASQNQFGKDFAMESAMYGSTQADSDMKNLYMVSKQVMGALSLLNDDHFALGFSVYVNEITKKCADDNKLLRGALNTIASQSWRIEKQSVRSFLDNIGYEYPTKNQPLQNNRYKY